MTKGEVVLENEGSIMDDFGTHPAETLGDTPGSSDDGVAPAGEYTENPDGTRNYPSQQPVETVDNP